MKKKLAAMIGADTHQQRYICTDYAPLMYRFFLYKRIWWYIFKENPVMYPIILPDQTKTVHMYRLCTDGAPLFFLERALLPSSCFERDLRHESMQRAQNHKDFAYIGCESVFIRFIRFGRAQRPRASPTKNPTTKKRFHPPHPHPPPIPAPLHRPRRGGRRSEARHSPMCTFLALSERDKTKHGHNSKPLRPFSMSLNKFCSILRTSKPLEPPSPIFPE